MLNLLKMDLRRLPRSMAFKVILILLAFDLTMTSFSLSFILNHAESAGEVTGILGLSGDHMTFGMFLRVTLGQLGDLALYPAIFIVLFTNGDFSTGFIKSVAGQVRSRGMLAVSKFITTVIYTVFYFAVYLLLSMLELVIFFDGVKVTDAAQFVQYLLLIFYMYLAMLILIAAIAQIFRSNLIGIIIGIMISTGLISGILKLINTLLKKLELDIDISKYTITGCITSVDPTGDLSDYTRHIIVCTVYIVIAVCAAIISHNKRDIA
ncbi:MAG: hypothetical protein IJ645_07255 [Ruminococcus sp.]|nr:hypothetical protein [Ruminococcus sp.]